MVAHQLPELSELSQREILTNKMGQPVETVNDCLYIKCEAFEEELNQPFNYPAQCPSLMHLFIYV